MHQLDLVFGLRDVDKNGVWGGLRRIIGVGGSGFGMDFLFEVGPFKFGRMSV